MSRGAQARLQVRIHLASGVEMSSTDVFGRRRHIDSARMYRNEAKVGEALRESGVPRDQIFISQCSLVRAAMSEQLNRQCSIEG